MSDHRQALAMRYTQVRNLTMSFSERLTVEDHVIQTAWFVSPAKWHLAHTTWFFETFILKPHWPEFKVTHEHWDVLFNSYYNAVGEQFPQARRGLLSRPTVNEVKRYRHEVDQSMLACIYQIDQAHFEQIETLVTLGLNHEQQHQELFLTDIKHGFATNPLNPIFASMEHTVASNTSSSPSWTTIEEGVYEVGVQEDVAFYFDNEGPQHRVFLHGAQVCDQLVTNRQYLAFMADGGYETVSLWLSDGWHTARQEQWDSPMYWRKVDGQWMEMTLHGLKPLALNAPVTHLSYYEADAYATWSDARLPTEFEWEVACANASREDGQFVDEGVFHPVRANAWFGSVWQWTSSPYTAYPGYRPLPGALGEYNGKFMCNTIVLRGGSCATSRAHIRPTYRNFFAPQTRWQFSGLRLAKEL